MKKRLFALLLVLVLALSLMSMAALADEMELAEQSMVEAPMEEAARGVGKRACGHPLCAGRTHCGGGAGDARCRRGWHGADAG